MRLYITGPMTGIDSLNYPAFQSAEAELIKLGYEVSNPFDHGTGGDLSYEEYLRLDLKSMLDCDGVATLPGWQNSNGASLEVHVAEKVGLQVKSLLDWLEEAA